MAFVRNPIISWLLYHSYGQGGTVAVPVAQNGSTASMPRGQFPPGINDLIGYLVQRYAAWSSAVGQIDWCFLVGGPGNGKSEALKELMTRLGIALPAPVAGEAVPRTIPQNWPVAAQPLPSGLQLVLINDASIPRPSTGNTAQSGSLFQDINDALSRIAGGNGAVVLFGNVNRGILVEEASLLAEAAIGQQDRLAASIVRWLAAPPSGEPAGHVDGIETVVSPQPSTPQYGQFRIAVQHESTILSVVVHVIFLDVLSMLEPTPGGGGAVIDFTQSPPAVAPYQTFGNLLSIDIPRDQTTAGNFLTLFGLSDQWETGGCREAGTGGLCEAYTACPFAQNSRWIQADPLRHRLLDSLRAAEIAAGRRLTYRDLLGHISLALIGEPEQSWLSGTHPCQWSEEQFVGVHAGQKNAIVNLISHRIYTNLFPVSSPIGEIRFERELGGDTAYGRIKHRLMRRGQAPRLQAYERAFSDIDPARDTDPWSGVRTRVLDAVESLDVVAPSEQLKEWLELPPSCNSEIESILDQVLRDEIATELKGGTKIAGNRARFLRSWRGRLVLRQVGLAVGRLTHAGAIQAWLAEQENALRGGSRLRLGDGIHNLIVPRKEGARIYLAPLRPRTYCLVSELPSTTLLFPITINDLDVVIVPLGDTLIAEVQGRNRQRRAPQALASLVIDLAVAREAILHANDDVRSFTEIGYTAFARIERARASLISRERLRAGGVYLTNEQKELYRIVANPSGPVPLRVEQS